MAPMSKFDAAYRSILLSKFFTKGWGKPENLKRLFEFRKVISDREQCRQLVPPNYPVDIDKVEEYPHCRLLEGHFLSPFVQHVPGVVPEESKYARFQFLLPKEWPAYPLRPVCLHLAGTGDHYFWRRRMLMARPLLKEAGIASIILENPFYGSRKPKNQVRSCLHNVSDIFVMGGCLVLESLVLFQWCEKQGFGPLGITGISMGGHMASIAGTNWHQPLALIPCLSWTTASCVFTQGVMSGAIPWHLLETQYFSDQVYEKEIRNMVHSPEENEAFLAGYHFSRTYPASMDHVKRLEAEESSIGNENLQTNFTHSHNIHDGCSENSANLNILNSHSFNQNRQAESVMQKNQSVSHKTNSLSYLKFSRFAKPMNSKKSRDHSNLLKAETLNFMRGIMDECTHLANFSCPVDPSLAIIVAAKHDAYVPREGIKFLPDLWPGCEVRYIDRGHIAAFLFNQGVFRKAIIDAFEKTAKKNYRSSLFTCESKKLLGQDLSS